MNRALVWLVVVGCGSEPAKPTTLPPVSRPVDAAVAGCNDAHDCELRDVCGCSCEGALHSAPKRACDESCPKVPNVCSEYTLICDTATHRCGAIPKTVP